MLGTRFTHVWLAAAALAAASTARATADDYLQYGLYADIINSPIFQCNLNESDVRDVSKILLYFYDSYNQVNTTHYINNAVPEIVDRHDLNFNYNFFVYVNGFGNITSNTNVVINNLYAYPNSYLIIVDSSYYLNNDNPLNNKKNYERAVSYCEPISRKLANFLVQFKERGANIDKFKMLGHSLGAQILGKMGVRYQNTTGERLKSIVGLDPAGPCFTELKDQLRKGNADSVFILHCNSGVFGTSAVVGDADFFANGGIEQPGCRTLVVQEVYLDYLTAFCSHKCCVPLGTLPALQPSLWNTTACDSKKHYDRGACANNEAVHFGIDVDPPTASGTFYFTSVGVTHFEP